MIHNNIPLSYFLAFCKNSWFWLGIWVFYYLSFTNYAGIGLIETSLIIAMTISEIPTGALADLIGKKKTLFISFLLQAAGGYLMAFAGNVNHLIISVFIMGIGGSFYSGTFEALIYDSLKEIKKENIYDQVISRINAINLAAPAICGLVGAYLFTFKANLPFLLNSLFYTLAIFIVFFLSEPKIDTVKLSLKNFLIQTKSGLKQLFYNNKITNQTIILLLIGFVVVLCDEMLNSFLAVEHGFDPKQQGLLWSGIFLITAYVSRISVKIKKYLNYYQGVIFSGILIALTMIISPLLGMVTGGIVLLIRSSLMVAYSNYTSILINESTPSSVRATTLSTFNLIKNIPYVLLAYLLGSWADEISALNLAAIIGMIMLTLIMFRVTKRYDNNK